MIPHLLFLSLFTRRRPLSVDILEILKPFLSPGGFDLPCLLRCYQSGVQVLCRGRHVDERWKDWVQILK